MSRRDAERRSRTNIEQWHCPYPDPTSRQTSWEYRGLLLNDRLAGDFLYEANNSQSRSGIDPERLSWNSFRELCQWTVKASPEEILSALLSERARRHYESYRAGGEAPEI